METKKSNKTAIIIAAIALCVAILGSIAFLITSLISPPIVSIQSKKALVGNTVDFDIKIKNNNGLYIGQLDFEYNPKVLEFITSSNGEVFDVCTVNGNDIEAGRVVIILEQMSLVNTKNDGVLTTITFRVKADAKKGDYAINFLPAEEDDKSQENTDNSQVALKEGTYFVRVQDISEEKWTMPKLKNGSISVK